MKKKDQKQHICFCMLLNHRAKTTVDCGEMSPRALAGYLFNDQDTSGPIMIQPDDSKTAFFKSDTIALHPMVRR